MGSSSIVEVFGINKVEQGIAMLFSSYGVANTVAPIIAGNLELIEKLKLVSLYLKCVNTNKFPII